MAEKRASLFETMQNPRVLGLRRLLSSVMGGRYNAYDEVFQRALHHLVTEADYDLFTKFLTELYECGYLQAVGDYKDQLAKLNIKVNVSQKKWADSQTK